MIVVHCCKLPSSRRKDFIQLRSSFFDRLPFNCLSQNASQKSFMGSSDCWLPGKFEHGECLAGELFKFGAKRSCKRRRYERSFGNGPI